MPPIIDSIDLAFLLATAIRDARLAIGWTQRELARRLGTNQSAIRRLESTNARSIDAALASAAMAVLGIRVTIDRGTLGAAIRREQRDAVHARCTSYLARRLERSGWTVAVEVEVGEGRLRGWIDLLAYHPIRRVLLVVQIKSEVDDAGRILRTLGWYSRASLPAARALGWQPLRAIRLLAVLASDDADARMTANRELLRRELPLGPNELQAWLEDPVDIREHGGVALIDPRSRRRCWLIRPRTDGRRSPLPYRDYRDAAIRLAQVARP